LYDYAWFVGFLVAGALHVLLHIGRAPAPMLDASTAR
jgi:cytosine/uracil/thiamine/allantoin permease